MSVKKVYYSLSFRLQSVAVFLSLVGFAFGIKTYLHVNEKFGAGQSAEFFNDLLLQLAVALVVNVLVAAVLYKIITQPIKRLSAAMEALTRGDTEVDVPYTLSPTEIGDMARKVEIFKRNAVEKIALEARQKEMEEKGRSERKEALENLASEFERDVKSVVGTVTAASVQLTQAATGMSGSVRNSSALAVNAGAAALQTAQNVNLVTQAAEQLAGSIGEISNQIQRTTSLVGKSLEQAMNADALASTLNDASIKVNDVMEMIADIAGQINLLALNATIESARAGEAGKGFSVVASEVKNLANQTDKSVAEIQKVVQEMGAAAGAIVSALRDIRQSVDDISSATSSVASAVSQQSDTTSEIVRNMQTAAQGTQLISENLDDVGTTSSEAGTQAEQMLDAAHHLTSQAETLDSQVNRFLNRIRAA